MAAANKSTGLQIALVFTVMSTIIALVVAFLQFRAANEAEARYKSASDQSSKAQAEKQVLADNIKNLQTFIGLPSVTDIGKPEAEGDGSVIGQTKKLMTDVAPGDLAQATVIATFQRLGQELDNLRKERATLQSGSIQLKERIVALEGEYKKMDEAHDKARADAEKDRGEAQQSKKEAVASKDKQIGEQQQKIQELQAQVQDTNTALAKATDETKKRIADLETINTSLRREKDAITKPSFEVADGTVEWVDRDINSVWINRGEADGLRKGTTFSIYKQINNGFARGTQDIKGAIEVTRITGAHQAEARITRSINSDPIVPGDPIYTPLWRPGRREQFALVGLIDLDGDGVSDRDILHDLIRASNGIIVDEVDDNGVRTPPQGNINVSTKFLVVGRIPDITESKPDEQKAHGQIASLHKKMVGEADEHGVRSVSLNDFLSYIGYEPGRRIWRPGRSEGSWNLRQGSHSTAAGLKSTNIRMPESTGNTSGAFKAKPAKRNESTGQTSGLFKQK